jgi:hypothetical protein
LALKIRIPKPTRTILLILFISVLVAVSGITFIRSLFLTPKDQTRTTLHILRQRIFIYADQHGKAPPSLKVLPEIQGIENETTDGWQHEIRYQVDAASQIHLTSLGKDELLGGENDDADMVCAFPLFNAQGNLMNGIVGVPLNCTKGK